MRKIVSLVMLLAVVGSLGLRAQGGCSVTLPWSEDFEGYPTGGASFPDCWTRVDSITPPSSSAVYPNLFLRSDAHVNVLNFSSQCSSCSNTYIYAATPRIPAPFNELEISFALLRGSVEVYVTDDLQDKEGYILVGAFENSSYTQWSTCELRTDTTMATPDTGYVVFGKAVTSSYNVAYVDDVNIMQSNPCPRPNWVRVDAVTTASAALSWPAVDGAQGYRVSYSTSEEMTGAEVLTTTATNILLNNLDVNTEYYVWVQTLCTENAASDARTATFATQLPCYPIVNLRLVNVNSYAASFEWEYDTRGYEASAVYVTVRDLTDPSIDDVEEVSVGATYHFVVGLDPTHTYEAVFRTLCGADTADGVSQSIVFRGCGGTALATGANDKAVDFPFNFAYKYSFSQMLYPASDVYDMDTIRGIAVHRDTAGSTVAGNRTVSIWMGNSSAAASSSSVSVAGMTHVAHGTQHFAAQEWDTILFSTPFVYDGTSNVQIVICDSTGTDNLMSASPRWWYHASEWPIYYNFNQTTAYDPTSLSTTRSLMWLPDMRFIGECQDNFSCDAPIAVVSAVDSTSATLEWTGGTAIGYVVEYRTEGGDTWTVVDTVTGESYTLTGLTPSMHYEARIGAICEMPTRYTDPVHFTTLCSPLHIPYHFEQSDMVAAVTNGFTPCYGHSRYFFRSRLTLSHRAMVYNAGNGEWFMLPPIIEPLAGARLRTWAACSSTSQVLVGVASESDASDVEWVDTLTINGGNPNTDTEEYIAYLDSYTGTGDRVVLSPVVDNNYTFVYFFDFHIEPIEGCRPPVMLTLDSADAGTMTVSWSPVGSATEWIVYVDGVENGVANTTSYTVTGLSAYTDYEITVRAACDGDETSLPVSATFRTGCEGESCIFTVAGHSSTANGWNGGMLVINTGDTVVGSIKMTNGRHTNRSFMVCDGMALEFTWLSGNADEVCSFEILNANGDTVYQVATASGLDTLSPFVIDSICSTGSGDDPEPGPGPGPGPGPEGIDDVDALASLQLAPNPASGVVKVTGVGERATVSILDINGREIFRQEKVAGSVEVDVERYARGIYFVRVVTEKASAVRRLVVR